MKPTLFIHAGLHKTGTSYIQRFLHENQQELIRQGLLYPWRPSGATNHHHIPAALRGNAFERLESFFDAIASKGVPTLVISSEELSVDFDKPENVDRYREFLSGRFDTRFIYYVRRQDHAWESVYAEECKQFLPGPISDDIPFRFDLGVRLDPLASRFGTERIIVRPYNPAHWAGGDIALDFLETIGVRDHSGFTLPGRENERLPRRKTLFLSAVDKTALPDRVAFLERVRTTTAIHDDGLSSCASPYRRRAFYERFWKSNQRTLGRFGIEDHDDFLGYAPPGNEWFPPAPITADEKTALL